MLSVVLCRARCLWGVERPGRLLAHSLFWSLVDRSQQPPWWRVCSRASALGTRGGQTQLATGFFSSKGVKQCKLIHVTQQYPLMLRWRAVCRSGKRRLDRCPCIGSISLDASLFFKAILAQLMLL